MIRTSSRNLAIAGIVCLALVWGASAAKQAAPPIKEEPIKEEVLKEEAVTSSASGFLPPKNTAAAQQATQQELPSRAAVEVRSPASDESAERNPYLALRTAARQSETRQSENGAAGSVHTESTRPARLQAYLQTVDELSSSQPAPAPAPQSRAQTAVVDGTVAQARQNPYQELRERAANGSLAGSSSEQEQVADSWRRYDLYVEQVARSQRTDNQ